MGCGSSVKKWPGEKELLSEVDRKLLKNTDNQVLQTFKKYDKSGDGFISRGELRAVLNELGVQADDDDVHMLMKAADVSSKGDHHEFMLEWNEMGHNWPDIMKKKSDEWQKAMLGKINAKASGHITKEDM